MKLCSLVSAAFVVASTAYTLSAGNPTIGFVAPGALTTMYATRYWNATATNGVSGDKRENAGATRTSFGVVGPSCTGNVGPTGTSMLLPNNATGRYKYTATIGVPTGLDFTIALSFITVVPTPAKSVTIVAGITGVAPTGYVHAYYGDPLRHPHLIGGTSGSTIFHNTPTAILTTEVVRTAGTVKHNKRETIEEGLKSTLPTKDNFFSTYRAGFMAHTQVFIRPAHPTAPTKLELHRRDAENDILAEDDLGYIASLNIHLGNMINAGLISANTTIEEIDAVFGDDDDLEKRQSNIQIRSCKLVGKKVSVAPGRHEVNFPEGTGRKFGAGIARKLGKPVRSSSQDDLTKTEIEVDVGAYDKYEAPFDRPADKFSKHGTRGAIVHIRSGTVVNLDEHSISAGAQPEIDAKLLLPTFNDGQFRNFWAWNNIREWSEQHFTRCLVSRNTAEDVEVIESSGQPIEVAKREAFYRVAEKDIIKNPPKVKLVGDTPMISTGIWVADGDKAVAAPAVDANVTVTATVWACGAGNAKPQTATVVTDYGNQDLDMVSFNEPTTFRTVKISLTGAVASPTVVLSGSFPILTPTAAPSTATKAQVWSKHRSSVSAHVLSHHWCRRGYCAR